MPIEKLIRSGMFTDEHIGTHGVNITIADALGAQISFEILFKVKPEDDKDVKDQTGAIELGDGVNHDIGECLGCEFDKEEDEEFGDYDDEFAD